MRNKVKEKNIFCIDDDPNMLRLLQSVLEDMENVKVHQFVNAYSAILAMRDIRPDLVLLDVMMPEMNGVVTYNKIRSDEKLKDVKVVFVTARKRETDMKQYKELGVPAITKPIDLLEFRNLIQVLL